MNFKEFFKSDELNHFYLSLSIMKFGIYMISLFVPIFLFTLGYAVSEIILFYLLISFFFLLFALPGAKIVSKIGVNHSILVSSFFLIAYYLCLNFLEEYNFLFFILPFLIAWRKILFNFSYHLNFFTYSEKEYRGRQVSFTNIIKTLVGVIAPAIGGLIASQSFTLLYLTGSTILALGVIPLFMNDELNGKVSFDFKNVVDEFLSQKGELVSFSGYAIEMIIQRIVWPLFIYGVVAAYEKVGFIVTLSAFFSMLLFYLIGKLTDNVDKKKLLFTGTILYSIGWIGRIFANTYNRLLLINSYKNFTSKLIRIPWSAYSYELAGKRDPFLFIITRELNFNLARLIFLPVLMLIFKTSTSPYVISFVIAGVASLGYFFLSQEEI